MKIFITGGTGFIGTRLIERLISENNEVVILARDPRKCEFNGLDKITLIQGDVLNEEAIASGMNGCEWVFHLAAFTKPWSKDPLIPFKTNVAGTENILKAALKYKVRKVIITSTGGTIGNSGDGTVADEAKADVPDYNTPYERTKAEAERIAVGYSQAGLNVVIVNPTRVYGPGKLTKSNSLTRIIGQYISGKWRILPGNGKPVGNYVFIDDVVEGHILAARYGRSGERYILGGSNHSFRDLFDTIGVAAGHKRRLLSVSPSSLKTIIHLLMVFTKISGTPPLITMDWFNKYMTDWNLSSDKAVRELGYKITPLYTGVSKTIDWIKSEHYGS